MCSIREISICPCLASKITHAASLLGEGRNPTHLMEALHIGWIKGEILYAIVIKDVYLSCIKRGLDGIVELAIDIPAVERLASRGGCYCLAASVAECSPHI